MVDSVMNTLFVESIIGSIFSIKSNDSYKHGGISDAKVVHKSKVNLRVETGFFVGVLLV